MDRLIKFERMRDERLNDPCVPYWAKDIIRVAEHKDVLDAVFVLRDLAKLFEVKYEEATGRMLLYLAPPSQHTCANCGERLNAHRSTGFACPTGQTDVRNHAGLRFEPDAATRSRFPYQYRS